MLLDNSGESKKVHEWIESNTDDGIFDVVTGYFTIGALAHLSEKVNEKISKFRMVLGDIANVSEQNFRPLDLLNQEISVDSALKLSQSAKLAIAFLKQDKVLARTLEPNFCHAKLYLHESKDRRLNYFITGSSNLTEAGIGLKETSNAELNIADTGENHQYKELREWFSNLWNTKALDDKTIGKKEKINFKKYLIAEISRIFERYTPNDIYLKILAEMELETDIEVETKLGKSKIYNALYDFQKAGVVSLVKMLRDHNGAILADAVGLGKTWTALAVIKFYQKKGFDIIVICPKKLENNWLKWKKNFDSIFKQDSFDYFIRFHTDLEEERMLKKGSAETSDVFFTSERPKLFVIDESHNLRNNRSKRYTFLLENILEKNENAKVLMLSATPINNYLLDIRNQFKLIPQMQNIDSLFRTAQRVLNKWAENENPKISTLIGDLPPNFLDTTDKFIVARTRSIIKQSEIKFPKWQKPRNHDKGCEFFDSLSELLPARFSAYMPAFYADITSIKTVDDESQRDLFLVKMMHFMLLKRLESSWYSFYKTVENILGYHKMVLEKVRKYEDFESGNFDEDELDDMGDDFEQYFELGKNREIRISDIKDIDGFKNDLTEDTNALQAIFDKLDTFDKIFCIELDEKLSKLIEIIKEKQKILIFTTYKSTAEYLYKHISKKFDNAALVHGGTQNIEEILQKFAPLAKFEESEKTAECKQKLNLALKEPINILITTDVLSEGQNLQDCDSVVNYDIHWNPVRVIQRMGRIDRIGSKHEKIYCDNFWPVKDINGYLGLQSRIEKRMIAMKIAGSEIPQRFTDKLQEMNNDKTLEQRQIAKNLKLMQESNIEDIETQNIGLNNLSLECFRQDLAKDAVEKYKSIPNGIFSGFSEKKEGLIVLMRCKKNREVKLVFINMHGKEILLNHAEILGFLRDNRYQERFVPLKIDECDETEIKKLSNALNGWFTGIVSQVAIDEITDLFSESQPINIFNQATVEERYKPQKWDLLCWCLVSEETKK